MARTPAVRRTLKEEVGRKLVNTFTSARQDLGLYFSHVNSSGERLPARSYA